MSYAYIAAPFFNEKELSVVRRIESILKDAGIKFFSPRSEGVLIEMTKEEKEQKMQEIYDSNVNHINECDYIIAVIDNWDTGTVFEIGYGTAKAKPIFTFSDNDYGLNVMIRQAVTIHNKQLDNLIINIIEFEDGEPLTIFDEFTKDVT